MLIWLPFLDTKICFAHILEFNLAYRVSVRSILSSERIGCVQGTVEAANKFFPTSLTLRNRPVSTGPTFTTRCRSWPLNVPWMKWMLKVPRPNKTTVRLNIFLPHRNQSATKSLPKFGSKIFNYVHSLTLDMSSIDHFAAALLGSSSAHPD